ncbi:MAG: GGDEF domain-containing response regulator [Planctomycetes bacterium]|nr:GGDEF domain-containing response regulator [Planctomycetota bacterium]
MNASPIRVLLIEDNPGDARLVQEYLAEAPRAEFSFDTADRLGEGLSLLSRNEYDVVLLDLSLPDARGMDTFIMLRNQGAPVPVVVLTGLDDESLGLKAMKEGAQDYLVKGQVSTHSLARSIRYAIERHRMQRELESLSLTDELTGLHNRRGFTTLSQQHLKLARRLKEPLILAFIDLDGLKRINDTYGHSEGDIALIQTAEILRKTFRDSDLIARLGGDEFTVLAIDADRDNAVVKRLQENFKTYNSLKRHPYELSVSVGITRIEPDADFNLEDVLSQADRRLYEEKRRKKSS